MTSLKDHVLNCIQQGNAVAKEKITSGWWHHKIMMSQWTNVVRYEDIKSYCKVWHSVTLETLDGQLWHHRNEGEGCRQESKEFSVRRISNWKLIEILALTRNRELAAQRKINERPCITEWCYRLWTCIKSIKFPTWYITNQEVDYRLNHKYFPTCVWNTKKTKTRKRFFDEKFKFSIFSEYIISEIKMSDTIKKDEMLLTKYIFFSFFWL